MNLTVNGKTVAIADDPATPLLDVLRNTLGLKGSRYGCGLEQCGACMVLIDGAPEFSCVREVGTLAGRDIRTVESLREHKVIAAFLAEQAGQCGYCLSGIVVSAAALLARNKDPSRAEIAAALDRNLCRCGAHPRIIRAVERAAAAMEGSRA
ncbi:MAG TPA: (2Fe-2S)-binding protein [Acetobacteraceae bacterium]|nr:(2Fe-2S)-binding protein [Acetobacteraceae bacterium]